MRPLTDSAKLHRLITELGRAVRRPARVYLTGGATAVLFAWRSSTNDVDLAFDPDHDEIYRAIATLKDSLGINIELASPAHFIPELPGWRERSVFIKESGPLAFYHYDFYAQCLSKIERGHVKDLDDVREMLTGGWWSANGCASSSTRSSRNSTDIQRSTRPSSGGLSKLRSHENELTSLS